MKFEMFFDEKKKEYTFSKERSIKKIPLKYKSEDSTRRFRTDKIREKLFG